MVPSIRNGDVAMCFSISKVTNSNEKSSICDTISRGLPNWFTLEDSILDYTKQVQTTPFYAAIQGDEPIAFLALKLHNAYTAEVYVMAVKEQATSAWHWECAHPKRDSLLFGEEDRFSYSQNTSCLSPLQILSTNQTLLRSDRL